LKNRTLYFGDNLEILRDKIADESFDLIYLDPPFNSSRSYNVIFKEGLQDSPAQIQAFDDSWHWTEEAKRTLDYLIKNVSQDISDLMIAFERILGHNDVLAYLSMMTIRLLELKRVLKDDGSIYLHCDPTASHYLKILLDTVFGKKNFRNEIIWSYKRWTAVAKRFQRMHDIIYFYTKSDQYSFGTILLPYTDDEAHYTEKDEKGAYRWQYLEGKKYKLYKKEGVRAGDVWNIPYLNSMAKERLGYPTQKPESLLERIIKTSSKEGDWVLDPFCGCGTTPAVAERLKRKWVGIDISTLAINLIRNRMIKQFELGTKEIEVDGLPKDLTGAKVLFNKDPFEFEYWVLDMVNAMPAKSKRKGKMRGADKGIDGIITFYKDKSADKWIYGRALVQVKGGIVTRSQIATLRGDVEREGVEAGVFISLENPSRAMIEEAIEAGSFTTPFTAKIEFPKIQIITVNELLKGRKLKLPSGFIKNYYKEAQSNNDKLDKTGQSDLNI
jgi:site-specific DNA-methyltransferase (adenine-specific)